MTSTKPKVSTVLALALALVSLTSCSQNTTRAAETDADVTVDEALKGRSLRESRADNQPHPSEVSPESCYATLGIRGANPHEGFERACRTLFEKQRADVGCRLKFPVKRPGCQGELCECTISKRLARSATVMSAPSKTSKTNFELRAGTTVKERELFVVSEKVGRAVVERAFDIDGELVKRLVVMDILRYAGEGGYEFCQGKTIKESLDDEAYWVAASPRASDWAHVRLADRRSGYIETAALARDDARECAR